MAKIIRTEPGAILSKAVEYHGFVYLPGITARDTSKDIKGQTADVLAQIDAMLEHHRTDKTRLLQAIHLGEGHQGPRRDERGLAPGRRTRAPRFAPACSPRWPRLRCWWVSWSPPANNDPLESANAPPPRPDRGGRRTWTGSGQAGHGVGKTGHRAEPSVLGDHGEIGAAEEQRRDFRAAAHQLNRTRS